LSYFTQVDNLRLGAEIATHDRPAIFCCCRMFEVKERPKMVENAYLVGVRMPEDSETDIANLLDELAELVGNLRIGISGREIVRLREGNARYLLGSGKALEVIGRAKALGCDCIVFDAELSPAQQRNWEEASGMCVIDRHEVILDIFNERAQTREAVLQVELARAEHSLPRLKNAWTHLSRQRGGGGVTQRGEGEAQIELDQRIVRKRIARLRVELEQVVRHRGVQRKRRMRVPLPTASIVGYTNAGKSTLLNALTGAEVLAADKLFATLDPTTRTLELDGGRKLLVTDTVGFVRRLPHGLVDAFKATLEEALVADFLIHVLDASHPDVEHHMETTLEVLNELGAADKRIITVYNKIDRLEHGTAGLNGSADPAFMKREPGAIYLSARTGEGLDELKARMLAILDEQTEAAHLLIPHDRYDVISQLHAAGCVKSERADDDGVHITANLPERLRALAKPFTVTD